MFAIPGSIHAAQSRGCHALLKQGAKLVECAQDVLDELQWGSPAAAAVHGAGSSKEPSTPAPESALLQALGHDPAGVDALQARTGLPTPALLADLMALELQGDVARLPGGLFLRVART